MFCRIFLLSLLVSGCATTSENCGVFERTSSEYRLCRAEQGSKEYQFRYGMEKYVFGDFREARRWLFSAASVNTKYKAVNLMPAQTVGTSESYNYSRREVREGGIEAAAYVLSTMYRDGVGGRVNERTAARYQREAGKWIVVVEETPRSYFIHVKRRMTGAGGPDKTLDLHDLYAFKVLRNEDG